jgi:hypothetical protein
LVVDGFALTPAEQALFRALAARRVRFVIVGLGAAVLEGAPLATQDLDVWFERFDDPAIRLAALDAGGFFISGFGMQPPAFGGPGFERVDVVLSAHGLESFQHEFEGARDLEVDGVVLRVLPLERVIASKRALGRPKDLAAMPALEATLAAKKRREPNVR